MKRTIFALCIACSTTAVTASAQPPVKSGSGGTIFCPDGTRVPYTGDTPPADACSKSSGAQSGAGQAEVLEGAFNAGVAVHQWLANIERQGRERRAARERARMAAEIARREQFVRDSIAAARAREEAWQRLSSQFQFSTQPQLELRLGSPSGEIGFRFDGEGERPELSNAELAARNASACTFMASCGEKTVMPELGDPMVVDLRHLRRAAHLLRQTEYAPAEQRESALDVATQIIEGSGPELEVPSDAPELPSDAGREVGAAVADRKAAAAERMQRAAAVDSIGQQRDFLNDVIELARNDQTLSAAERAQLLAELARQLGALDSAFANANAAHQRAQDAERRATLLERSTLLRVARGEPRPMQAADGGVVDLRSMGERPLVVSSAGSRDTTKSGLRIVEPPSPEVRSTRTYIPQGTGLVGGTGWIVGYNVPDGPEGERIRAQADAVLQKLKETGAAPDIDQSQYRFILGVAASNNEFRDLRTRVLFDNLRNGRASAENQALYASLTGRQFDNLDCHSNGAMVCLAAIENADIRARHVRLFGPQITPESAAMWNSLVEKGEVASVTVYASPADFVPRVSYLLGALTQAPSEALNLVWGIESALKQQAPRLSFIAPECVAPSPLSVHCHSMSTYQKALRPD